jgi:hypothetical protein
MKEQKMRHRQDVAQDIKQRASDVAQDIKEGVQHVGQDIKQGVQDFEMTMMDWLKPHFLYLGLSLGLWLLTSFMPGWGDASVYHLDFKKVFGDFQIWRLFTCLLVAGQFLSILSPANWLSGFSSPMNMISGFLPFVVLQSGWVHLTLCFLHLRRLWISATTSNKKNDFFLSMAFVISSIWLIKFVCGTFLEEKAYQRLQQNKYSTFDGLFSLMTTIINETSFLRALQYHLSIFPAYFMFTMAIVSLSAYKTPHSLLNLRFTTMHYWALPWILIAAQFICTMNSPLRNTLLINNLVGFGIGRAYKAISECQPIRQKLNHVLGTHLQ